jgi:hypothetical protein
MQEVLVGVLLMASIVYLAKILSGNFRPGKVPDKNCHSCGISRDSSAGKKNKG